MKHLTLIPMCFAVLAGACGGNIPPFSGNSEAVSTASPVAMPSVEKRELWMPKSIENCIASVRDDRIVEPTSDFNPYYLHADFDSDGVVDVAVLVRSAANEKERSNGVLLCIENRDTGRFGNAFFKGTTLPSFDWDNFVTDSWEVIPRGRLRDHALDERGKPLLQGVAKGDVIGFFNEGGAVFVYWDGSRFKAVEGL